MIEYAKSKNNAEMECLVGLMYRGAMRIQDAAEITYGEILKAKDYKVVLKA